MATPEAIDRYCRNCVSRDFVNGRGLICKRTSNPPAFEETCEDFQKDEALEQVAPPKPEDFPENLSREQLLSEENLPKGLLFGIIAAVIGAAAWALVSVSTGFQIGYMAIGIGFLVGFAMRQGKGVRPIFGIIGAALALVSCLVGDYLSIVGAIASEYEMGYMEALTTAPFAEMVDLLKENLLSMTALFYGIALYEGYKLSFRPLNQPQGGSI